MKPAYKRALKLAAVAVALGVFGLAAVASGVVPIKASSGHWAPTRWFLQFAKERSVATHTIGIDVPDLATPGWVEKGAGHYESGCRPCHGAPGQAQSLIVRAMTPHPPDLSERVKIYRPEELFYIVKHGIKFTGMPAWPSQERDDEVWAMVAFLMKYPSLDAAEYRELAFGEADPIGPVEPLRDIEETEVPPSPIVTSCARCHGFDGLGRGLGVFPVLAGQRVEYQILALEAYARGERHSGIMQPIAAMLTQDEILAAARYYAEQPIAFGGDGAAIAGGDAGLGRDISTRGIPARRVPACRECHGPGDHARNPVYPLLAGQYRDYVALQLELFKQRQRGGSAYGHIMHDVVSGLEPPEMRAVASYYSSLRPGLVERPR